jgi:hypothetical protein
MEEFPPTPFDRKKSVEARSSQKKRLNTMEEFLSRSEDYNVGGVSIKKWTQKAERNKIKCEVKNEKEVHGRVQTANSRLIQSRE